VIDERLKKTWPKKKRKKMDEKIEHPERSTCFMTDKDTGF